MPRKLKFENQITLRIGKKAKTRLSVISFRKKKAIAEIARAKLYEALNLKEEDEAL